MRTEMRRIKVSELVCGYENNDDDGVIGYDGKLNIRPPYQREFVYNPKQQRKVIDSILRDFPLGEMHWFVQDEDAYEIIDGQQRTISIAQYIEGDFAVNEYFFDNLTDEEQNQINNYKLTIYLFRGKDRERLDWFERINTTGESLRGQEILNAVYAGPWVSDARNYFSKTGCVAYKIGNDYLNGVPIRQDYLETVIRWISAGDIKGYMGRHQQDTNAKPLWEYFQSVIDWVEATFTKKRVKFMKGVDWGRLYNEHKDAKLDPGEIEKETARLVLDDYVTNRKGIYEYILTRNEKHLNIRAFSDGMKQKAYEKQSGICAKCNKDFRISEMEADHITPWSEGGKTIEENCQMLCKPCNRAKSAK